jgi:hypothetical protein
VCSTRVSRSTHPAAHCWSIQIRVKSELKLCGRRRGSGELRGRGSGCESAAGAILTCDRSHQKNHTPAGTSAEDLRSPCNRALAFRCVPSLGGGSSSYPWSVIEYRLFQGKPPSGAPRPHTPRGAFTLIAAHNPRAERTHTSGGPSCSGNSAQPTSDPSQLGCWSVAPFCPHTPQRADARSTSDDVSGPHRIISGVSATGAL